MQCCRQWLEFAVTSSVTDTPLQPFAPTPHQSPHRNERVPLFAITNCAEDFAAKIGAWRYAVTHYAANYAAKQRGSDFTHGGFTHRFTHRNPGAGVRKEGVRTETSCFSMCTDWLRTMIKADVPLMISDNFLEVMHGRLW